LGFGEKAWELFLCCRSAIQDEPNLLMGWVMRDIT
jgi:hypothetical protein